MRKVVTGEQVAQIANPDPFALPVWRAPVYRTPLGVVLAVKVFRLLAWLIRLVARHPLAASVLALLAVTWADLGWLGLVRAWPPGWWWSLRPGGGSGRPRSPAG